MAKKQFLTDLCYPAELHDRMFVIRRWDKAHTVWSILVEDKERGVDPTTLVRLSADCDFFRLPANKRIEYVGCDADVTPKFIRMDGQDWVIVEFTKSPAWFSWNGGCLIIPPGPEALREDAEKLDATDPNKAALYRTMADWIERIPIALVVDPNAPAPPMPEDPPPQDPSPEEVAAARAAAEQAILDEYMLRLV